MLMDGILGILGALFAVRFIFGLFLQLCIFRVHEVGFWPWVYFSAMGVALAE